MSCRQIGSTGIQLFLGVGFVGVGGGRMNGLDRRYGSVESIERFLCFLFGRLGVGEVLFGRRQNFRVDGGGVDQINKIVFICRAKVRPHRAEVTRHIQGARHFQIVLHPLPMVDEFVIQGLALGAPPLSDKGICLGIGQRQLRSAEAAVRACPEAIASPTS